MQQSTTQKGVDNNKIFELRAGLETCNKCHFYAIKKRNNLKNRFKIGLNDKKEVLGYFPNDLGHQGHPWGGLARLKKITSIHSRERSAELYALKTDLAEFF